MYPKCKSVIIWLASILGVTGEATVYSAWLWDTVLCFLMEYSKFVTVLKLKLKVAVRQRSRIPLAVLFRIIPQCQWIYRFPLRMHGLVQSLEIQPLLASIPVMWFQCGIWRLCHSWGRRCLMERVVGMLWAPSVVCTWPPCAPFAEALSAQRLPRMLPHHFEPSLGLGFPGISENVTLHQTDVENVFEMFSLSSWSSLALA